MLDFSFPPGSCIKNCFCSKTCSNYCIPFIIIKLLIFLCRQAGTFKLVLIMSLFVKSSVDINRQTDVCTRAVLSEEAGWSDPHQNFADWLNSEGRKDRQSDNVCHHDNVCIFQTRSPSHYINAEIIKEQKVIRPENTLHSYPSACSKLSSSI